MNLQVAIGGLTKKLDLVTDEAIAAHDQSTLAHPDIRLLLGPGAYGVKMTATGGGFGTFVSDTESSEPASAGNVEALNGKVLALEGGLASVKADAATLTSAFADQVTLTAALSDDLDSLTASVASIESDLADQATLTSAIGDSVDALGVDLTDLTDDLAALTARVTGYHTGGIGVIMTATGGGFGEFESVVDELTAGGGGNTAGLEEAVSGVSAGVVTLTAGLASLQGDFDTVFATVAGLVDDVASLQGDFVTLAASVDSLWAEFNSETSLVSGINDSVIVLRGDVDSLTADFALVQGSVTGAVAAVDDLTSLVTGTVDDFAALSAKVSDYHAGALGILMTSTGGGFGEFRSVADETSYASDAQVNELDGRVTALEDGLASVQADVATLTSGLAEQVTLTAAMGEDLTGVSDDLVALTTRVTEYHTGCIGVIMNATGGGFGEFESVFDEASYALMGQVEEIDDRVTVLEGGAVTVTSGLADQVTLTAALTDSLEGALARVTELEGQLTALAGLVAGYHNAFGVLMAATGGGFGTFVSVTD